MDSQQDDYSRLDEDELFDDDPRLTHIDRALGDILVDHEDKYKKGPEGTARESGVNNNAGQDDLDTIYEEDEVHSDSHNRHLSSTSNRSLTQPSDPTEEFSDSDNFIKSVLSYYDPEKEQLMLEQIDLFLKSDQPKTYN